MTTIPASSKLKQIWRNHLADIDHAAVQGRVEKDGRLSYPFVFLIIVSCAIATLGLLLNSTAVIIGAMLVAPMMGPIVLLGFSIAHTDTAMAARSGLALLAGIAGALLISIAIVKIAPFIPAQAEILSRTNPNLFDLLVAIFSGLAAGYAVIRGQGGVAAGVAIATALMPPLAVVGYGIATLNLAIFTGASLLFLTNLLAIAFTVAFMALWYGLGKFNAPRELLWKTIAAGIVLALLSVPLASTLNDSVRETWRSKQIEDVLRQSASKNSSTLEKLQVHQELDTTMVHAVLLTKHYEPQLETGLQHALEQRLKHPVKLRLDQIETAGEQQDKITALSQATTQPAMPHPLELLRLSFPFPLTTAEISTDDKTAHFHISTDYHGALSALQEMETTLKQKFPGWQIEIIPPAVALPAISFAAGESLISAENITMLETSAWALLRWHTQQANVTGFASLYEKGSRTKQLASARAEAVSEFLRAKGIDVTSMQTYPVLKQSRLEREKGKAFFRQAEIIPQDTVLQ